MKQWQKIIAVCAASVGLGLLASATQVLAADDASKPAIIAKFNELMSGQGFVKPPFAFVAWNETDLRNQMKSTVVTSFI